MTLVPRVRSGRVRERFQVVHRVGGGLGIRNWGPVSQHGNMRRDPHVSMEMRQKGSCSICGFMPQAQILELLALMEEGRAGYGRRERGRAR